MNDAILNLLLFVLASPVYFAKWLRRMQQQWRFYRISYTLRITCQNCQATISLVGIWRCGCGYTYRGHVLRVCPVCGALPRMVRCFSCGVTKKLPEL